MRNTLGDSELELLRHVAEHAPVTVRQVADTYGADHGLARTTVLTVMERLRKKGFLARRPAPEGFVYSATEEEGSLLHGVVASFVRNTLGGSVSPFAAYLAQSDELTDAELDELRAALETRAGRGRDA